MIRIRTQTGEETLDLGEFESRVVRGEIPPDTPVCFPVVSGEDFVPARELEIFRGLYSPSRIYFKRYFNLASFPALTTVILVANVAVFVAGQVLLAEGSGNLTAELVRLGAKAGPLITDLGESWRLLTANFVHRDLLHLGFNLFFLFNLGGALENTYRKHDYLLIVLASALGTTILSFLGSSQISAGASGIVFGCFGGVVVFGLKYRDIIPRRYRRFFGGAVVPYVLIFLWLGWMSAGIDNWGHLGGLLGGSLCTFLMRPRLLDAGTNLGRRRVLRYGLTVAVIGLTFAVGPAWTRLGASLVVERDDDLGLEVAHPLGWRRAITDLGQIGFSNGLPVPTYLQADAREQAAPIDLEAVADQWFSNVLEMREHQGLYRGVRREPPRPAVVAGREALLYRAAFEASPRNGPTVSYLLTLYVFARGEIACAVAMYAPTDRFQRYQPIFDQMKDSIRLTEPRSLRLARAATLLDPGDLEAHLRLAEAWQRTGERQRAVATYEDVLARNASQRPARLALARLWVDEVDALEEGVRLLDGLLPETTDPEERVELLLLGVRYDLQQDHLSRAHERLEELLALAPEDPRVRQLAHHLPALPEPLAP
ncbi:MAG: rhomboid family intramembrane serine protease [Deltaproteobacteria bacterium]|nr:rhomboid family intramembrane serine protease [Deltaproteobacteria bacterium]